jgi:hypothetical protein
VISENLTVFRHHAGPSEIYSLIFLKQQAGRALSKQKASCARMWKLEAWNLKGESESELIVSILLVNPNDRKLSCPCPGGREST